MTPELTAVSPGEASKQIPSTAGMTTKVVKGSMWTLGGQVVPLLVSFITTPFVIRMLGAEGYGVFILIGLIPTYLAFADFGMSMASTRFAAEAFGEGDLEGEARIIRTALLVTFCTAFPFAVGIFLSANWLAVEFNIPEHLVLEAALGLRIGAATFLLNLFNNIINTPQLTRLRMDLNVIATLVPRLLTLVVTPVVLVLGGGVLGAVIVLFFASVLTFLIHFFVATRLVRGIFGATLDSDVTRRLVRFGGAFVLVGAAGILLANVEKGILPKMTSVDELAYYSVAFTLALLMTMFSSAMTQSLIPAFAQLRTEQDGSRLESLYLRSIRLIVFWLVPLISFLSIIAQPFFTLWAGGDFGERSTPLFLIFSIGLLFNLPTYVPYAAIVAAGRTDLLARVYFLELLPYVCLVLGLTYAFGVLGTAAAWSLRMWADAIILFIVAGRTTGIAISRTFPRKTLLLSLVMFIPLTYHQLLNDLFTASIVFVVCFTLYCWIVWNHLLHEDELLWIRSRVASRMAVMRN